MFTFLFIFCRTVLQPEMWRKIVIKKGAAAKVGTKQKGDEIICIEVL